MQPSAAPISEPVSRPDREPEPETLAALDLDNMREFKPVPVSVN
jgi:hypothetical protein